MIITEALLAELCRDCYLHPNQAAQQSFRPFTHVAAFQNSGAECIVAEHNGTAVLCIRGTERSLLDVISDIQFLWPQPYNHSACEWDLYSEGHVHRGFARFARRILESGAVAYLISLNPDKLIVCGHSLGGAAATICARELHDVIRDPVPIHLFTIGQPRVGTADFASFVEDLIAARGGSIVRIANSADPVPHLPPHGMAILPLYRHAGRSWLLDNQARLAQVELIEEILLTLWRFVTSPLDCLKAHNSDTYVRLLEEWGQFRSENGLATLIRIDTDE